MEEKDTKFVLYTTNDLVVGIINTRYLVSDTKSLTIKLK